MALKEHTTCDQKTNTNIIINQNKQNISSNQLNRKNKFISNVFYDNKQNQRTHDLMQSHKWEDNQLLGDNYDKTYHRRGVVQCGGIR